MRGSQSCQLFHSSSVINGADAAGADAAISAAFQTLARASAAAVGEIGGPLPSGGGVSIAFGVEKTRVGYDTNRVKVASDENENEDGDDGR